MTADRNTVTEPDDDGQDHDDENDAAASTIDVGEHVGKALTGDHRRWPMIGRPTGA